MPFAMHGSRWMTPGTFAMLAVLVLSGCVERPSTTPVSTPVAPNPASVAPAPATQRAPPVQEASPKAAPGTAFGPKVYAFQASPLPNETFPVAVSWTTLRFTYWLNSTGPCYFVQQEPPTPGTTSTGAAPSLAFRSPAGAVVAFPIPTQNVCGTTTSSSLTDPTGVSKDAAAERGTWTLTIHGVGQNVNARVEVDGR